MMTLSSNMKIGTIMVAAATAVGCGEVAPTDAEGADPESIATVAQAIAADLCPPQPRTDVCAVATKSGFQLRGDAGDEAAKLKWDWVGETPSFGTPETNTTYVACVDDGDALVSGAYIPPGPAWYESTVGHRYSDWYGNADGINKVDLRAYYNGRGKVKVQGHGANLSVPATQFSGAKVTVQLNAMGVDGDGNETLSCWSAGYPSGKTQRIKTSYFKGTCKDGACL